MAETKKVTFEDEKKKENEKLTISEDQFKKNPDKVIVFKVEYVWQHERNKFISRNKILKTNKKTVDIPVSSTYYNEREFILVPKFITVNPFRSDDSVLAICDVLNSDATNITFEKRSILTDLFEKNQSFLNEFSPRFAFKLKIIFNEVKSNYEKKKLTNNLIDLSLKARINVSEYYFDGNNFIIENDFMGAINCAEELLTFKYILNIASEMYNFDYKLDKTTYFKFMDNLTSNNNSLEKIKEYSSHFSLTTTIPDTVKKFGKGYLIGEIDENTCVFEYFKIFIEKIYLNTSSK